MLVFGGCVSIIASCFLLIGATAQPAAINVLKNKVLSGPGGFADGWLVLPL
jgi:hypothetical protein